MHIAQIAPLTESIPPKLYGGTERVVSWLTDELVSLGHDVVLFASGDSHTSAKLESCWPKALRLDNSIRDPNALKIEATCTPVAPAPTTSIDGGTEVKRQASLWVLANSKPGTGSRRLTPPVQMMIFSA